MPNGVSILPQGLQKDNLGDRSWDTACRWYILSGRTVLTPRFCLLCSSVVHLWLASEASTIDAFGNVLGWANDISGNYFVEKAKGKELTSHAAG
jgi:hypothetical protein